MISLFGCLQASFVASGNRTDISLDDPNFWDKWAKKAEIDMETVNGRVSSLFFFSFHHNLFTNSVCTKYDLKGVCIFSKVYNEREQGLVLSSFK